MLFSSKDKFLHCSRWYAYRCSILCITDCTVIVYCASPRVHMRQYLGHLELILWIFTGINHRWLLWNGMMLFPQLVYCGTGIDSIVFNAECTVTEDADGVLFNADCTVTQAWCEEKYKCSARVRITPDTLLVENITLHIYFWKLKM